MACDRAIPDRVPPPLAEGEHRRELKLTRGRRSVEVFRQGTELHSRTVQALEHQQPVGEPASGRTKVDRVGGRSPTFSCHPAPEVAPKQDGLWTSFWSALEWSMWMNRAGRVVHKRAFVTLGHNSLRSAWLGVGHKGIVQFAQLEGGGARGLRLPPHQLPKLSASLTRRHCWHLGPATVILGQMLVSHLLVCQLTVVVVAVLRGVGSLCNRPAIHQNWKL